MRGLPAISQDLKRQGDALVGLGGRGGAEMDARQDQAIQALEGVTPEQDRTHYRRLPADRRGGGAGPRGRRADRPDDGPAAGGCRATPGGPGGSLVASLKPAVQESMLAGLDQRLPATLASNDTKLRIEVAEQISRDLHRSRRNSRRTPSN